MPEVIVALDGITRPRAMMLAEALSGKVWGFKVNDLLLTYGINIVKDLTMYGRVMADPKLYDIPNTVSNAVIALAGAGAALITVHASGGKTMLEAAVAASRMAGADYRRSDETSKIIGVTLLTSMSDVEVYSIYSAGRANISRSLLSTMTDAGCHGLVCPASFLPEADKYVGLLKVVPGIRLDGLVKGDDQIHVASEVAQIKSATHVVVGRPIVQADDPIAAAVRIAAELKTP